MKEIQALPNERVSMTWEQYQAMRALIKQLGEALDILRSLGRNECPDLEQSLAIEDATSAYNNYLRERGE